MTGSNHRELVDFHIRSAVAAARRKGATHHIEPRSWSGCVAAIPRINIQPTYVLDRIVHAARDSSVAIEVDRDFVDQSQRLIPGRRRGPVRGDACTARELCRCPPPGT